MFGKRPDLDQSRIRLPRRSLPPTKDYLEFAFAQAFQYKDKEVEISWSDNNPAQLFRLIVKVEGQKPNPCWRLFQENQQNLQLVWMLETCDLDAVALKISTLDLPDRKDSKDTAPESSVQDVIQHKSFATFQSENNASGKNSLRDSFSGMRGVNSSTRMTSLPANAAMYQRLAGKAQETTPIISPDKSANQVIQIILGGIASLIGGQKVPVVDSVSDNLISGNLEQTRVQNKHLIKIISVNKLSGKLEILNEAEGIGQIFFENGVPYRAQVFDLDCKNVLWQADAALIEIAVWPASKFRFTINIDKQENNLISNWEELLNRAKVLQEQLFHLIKDGLQGQSLMIKKQDGLGEAELRLLLSKNSDTDPSDLIALYKRLPKKFTLSEFCQGDYRSKILWIPAIFAFFTNNLIEIKAPLAVDESSLEFLGEIKGALQSIKASFIRQETGIFSYPGLLYFLQYEYLRYQAHDCSLSLVIFEMAKISDTSVGGLDLISQSEAHVALQRIIARKRITDILGHFETMDYALLLPNTAFDDAQKLAQNIIDNLKAEPLSAQLNSKFLKLSFGIGSIPGDFSDLESLVICTKKALQESKNGDFNIVRAHA